MKCWGVLSERYSVYNLSCISDRIRCDHGLFVVKADLRGSIMKDWIVAILIAWLIYVYIFGGSLAGLGQLITGARNAVSQHDPVSQSDG